jgi:hypothetical protein
MISIFIIVINMLKIFYLYANSFEGNFEEKYALDLFNNSQDDINER